MLAGIVACALFAWAFDWVWFRPLIQHYVQAHSGRRIDFDELHVGLTAGFDPTLRVRGLVIENAAWAARRPLVRAGEVTFVFSWRSIGTDKVVLTRIDLVDAEVDLERRADGERNWRLRHPDDRGPTRVKVLSLAARRSELRFVHGGLDLEVETRISPLAAPQVDDAHPQLPLTQWLVFNGKRSGQAFAGETAVSELLTFDDTGLPFALRGRAQAGQARLEVDGIVTDLFKLAALDADIKLSAHSLAELRPILGTDGLPASQPCSVSGHLVRRDATWTATRLHATTGRSDLAGELSVTHEHDARKRPFVHAALHGKLIDTSDFATWTGQQRPAAARLHAIDGDVDLRIDELVGALPGAAHTLHMVAALRDGVLKVQPFDLGLAGGHAAGMLRVDAKQTPAEVDLSVDLHGLRLEKLMPAAAQAQRVAGELHGHVALRTRGDSMAMFARGATGSASAELSGASISNRLDAKLGLDGGGLLRAFFVGPQQVPVQCARVDVDIKRGNGTVRRLLIETERSAVTGHGSVDLAHESLDLVLTPHLNKNALLALHKAIHLSGPWVNAKVAVVDADPAAPLDHCDAGAQAADPRSAQNR